MNRELDGYYFRIKRDGEWKNICFSDLTEGERYYVMNGMDVPALKILCIGLADVIKDIGDQFDLIGGINGF